MEFFNENRKMKTIEVKIYDLCEEIDYWKEKTEKAEKDAEYWRKQYDELLNQNIKSANEGVANALRFALAIKEDEKGNIVIDKESRETLTYQYKPSYIK